MALVISRKGGRPYESEFDFSGSEKSLESVFLTFLILMATTADSIADARKYKRRSDDERIADLERRITELKARQAAKSKRDDPVVREIPKVQRRLRKFAQLALNHNRPDIANSITAFTAGLERILRHELSQPAHRTAQVEMTQD